MNERLALDTRKWLPKPGEEVGIAKQRASEDLAYAIREQLDTKDFEKSINPGRFLVNERGKLENPIFGEIEDILREETEIDRLENEAFRKIQDWASSNNEGVVVWISPPIEGVYSETRIIVNEIKHLAKQKCVEYKAIRSNLTTDECLQIARQLVCKGAFGLGELEDDKSLRKNPIEIDLNEKAWIDLIEDLVPNSSLGESIKSGKDIKGIKAAKKIAEEIINDTYKTVAFLGEQNHLIAGACIEDLASKKGYEMQPYGSCGTSNKIFLKRSINDIFFADSFSNLNNTKDWDYAEGVCRVCEENSMVGPCGICINCEKYF